MLATRPDSGRVYWTTLKQDPSHCEDWWEERENQVHPSVFCPSNMSPKELWLRNRVTRSRCIQSQPCQPLVKQKISLVNPENMESYLIDFTIVDGNFALLLGLETAQKMSYWLCKLRTFWPLEKTHRNVMLRSLSSQEMQ